jgi:serine/threonine-protein kinase
VHRDLKPENFFACKDGSVKVLDFGIARVKEVVSQPRLTTTGVPMGTPAYMPAEQALARWHEVDARSDVWSLGASFFSLLTGEIVHVGTTVPELLVAVSTTDARPVRSLAPQVPIPVAAVIDRALRRARSERFADAGEMLTALRAAMSGQVLGPTPSDFAPRSVDGRSLHAIDPAALRRTGSPVSTDASRREVVARDRRGARVRAAWLGGRRVEVAVSSSGAGGRACHRSAGRSF